MPTVRLASLNEQYAISNYIEFSEQEDGFIIATLSNSYGVATVSLYAGHVLSYIPTAQEPVLWLSSKYLLQIGKAIRGGIPICWPWFGDHPDDSSKPAHGIARTGSWTVASTNRENGDTLQLKMILDQNETTAKNWPHKCNLELIITLSNTLTAELITHNTGEETIVISEALHSYFAVKDITKTTISGLKDTYYNDKANGTLGNLQSGNVSISEETDRVYLNTSNECVIEDKGNNRQIRVGNSGSQSTVIWNPWQDKAKSMADFDDDGYKHMVCVETANAIDNSISLVPGEKHSMSTIIDSIRI